MVDLKSFYFQSKKVPCNEQGCLYPLYFGKTFAWGFQKGATYTLIRSNNWEKYISNIANWPSNINLAHPRTTGRRGRIEKKFFFPNLLFAYRMGIPRLQFVRNKSGNLGGSRQGRSEVKISGWRSNKSSKKGVQGRSWDSSKCPTSRIKFPTINFERKILCGPYFDNEWIWFFEELCMLHHNESWLFVYN